ncbi:metallophosphoesterase [Ignicoccus pacificus DSM 13166]|uniref:Metallophosphoesterase n=1 Tax=Ignicoccus pacificus DSM 13166 TaxID=940294 RepID=A0A977PKG8_9CREN|nr:metallophosphoesterase [Ignicoccus pacificus DSM 13166]
MRKVLNEEEYDLVVVSGDLECLSTVRALEEARSETLAVTGNLDDPQIADELERLGYSIENKVVEVGDLRFAGVSAQSIETSVNIIRKKNFDVLVSHYPPKGILDRAWSGAHIGLYEIRELLEEKRPKLALVGHVHESRGYQFFSETLVVNPGPLRDGYYAIVIADQGRVVLKRLRAW